MNGKEMGNKVFESGNSNNTTKTQPKSEQKSEQPTYNPENDTRSSGQYAWPTPD